MAKIAVPLAADFEDSEFSTPYERLKEAGHELVIVGTERGATVEGKRGKMRATIQVEPADLRAVDFDAVVIPGGYSPDHLRTDEHMVRFVREFEATGRPLAAICHGPQLLIEADAVRGRKLTSWPSVRKDLENAGAEWVDRPVVVDGNLVTSRKPDDVEVFCTAILERLRAAA